MSFIKPALLMLGQIFAALIVVAASVALVRFVALPLLQMTLNLGEESLAHLRHGLMLLGIGLGYWAYVRLVERRAAPELALKVRTIVLTALLGVAILLVPVTLLYMTGTYTIVGIGPATGMASIALFILAAATFEEILFRGIAFGIIERHFGSWPAIILPTAIFSIAHIFNDNWGGWLSLGTGITIGAIWTLLYMLTRNIWAVALNHASWNFTIVLTGLPLTGIQDWRDASPIRSEFSGPDWWSGGLAGPENSVLMLTVSGLAVIALLVIVMRRGLIRPAERNRMATQADQIGKRGAVTVAGPAK